MTIADGHHRYETALRYRDERRMTRSCEEDPAFDYLLTLFLEATHEQLTVLPTHRIVARDSATRASRPSATGLGELFEVERRRAATTSASSVRVAGWRRRAGRFGLWTRHGGVDPDGASRRVRAVPSDGRRRASGARRDPPRGGPGAARRIDAAAVAAGAVGYTKSAAEAIDAVDARLDGADAAFLLEPTPVAVDLGGGRGRRRMPQKSTYFYPKALTGLVINPHEW